MQDEHSALRHARIEELERRLHRPVEVAIDMRESKRPRAYLLGDGRREEPLQLGCDVVVTDGLAHIADRGIAELKLVGLVRPYQVTPIEA